ncbi:MAG: NADH-quinone oxidoreductase subunit D [Elusimicrobia bacterium]|nr:MAG: NADH-quinone oxidoreductase subunit D [Elusimicrobiota bacterium]
MTQTTHPAPQTLKSDQLFVNLGPQHPSTHGVLRVGLTIEGEIVVKAVPEIGYLHRGTEKLAELRGYHHCVVISDRWDYLSATQHLRVAMCELNRIASHLLFFGTFGIDMGAFTAFLHAFRERELVLDLFEMSCGARLTYNYIRLGGVMKDVDEKWLAKTKEFLEFFKPRLAEYDDLLSFNPIFLDRTKGVGPVTAEQALSWGLSGPMLRASGVSYDARKWEPYCTYSQFSFDVPLGEKGDCWDRYYCRVREMHESVKIVEQAIAKLQPGPVLGKGVAKVPKPVPGETYVHIEGARGNLGLHLVSDGNGAPYRLHLRAPSFINLAMLQEILVGERMSDVIAILGSTDIVLGEVDR